jgi:hypothetical protein
MDLLIIRFLQPGIATGWTAGFRFPPILFYSEYASGRDVKLNPYLHLMPRLRMVELYLRYFIRPYGLVLNHSKNLPKSDVLYEGFLLSEVVSPHDLQASEPK